MKEPYKKGVANHLDPESWVALREGGGQALTGACVGRVLSREMSDFRGADTVGGVEGNTASIDIARKTWTPRGLRPRACTESSSRKLGDLMVLHWRVVERKGKSKDVSPR